MNDEPLPPPLRVRTSYRALTPLEEGGRAAKDGFDYQDHVAVSKCLDMLAAGGPIEVWCEAEDDLVLVWRCDDGEQFEFVQVKSDDLGQAWTVAKLCAREASKNGKQLKRSIVEKSLAHARGAESCRFKIVTRWEPDPKKLAILKLAADRRDSDEAVKALEAATAVIQKQLGDCASPNGDGIGAWVQRTTWEVQGSTQAVRNESIVKLGRALNAQQLWLATDQIEELHDRLLRKVQAASLADARTDPKGKRLSAESLRSWLASQADQILHPNQAGGTSALERKLVDAGIDETSRRLAAEQRLRYLREAREPRYVAADDRDLLEGEIQARLNRLKIQLEAGELADNGRQFLSRCQSELLSVRDSLSGQKAPESIVFGYMYDVMNRCLHRLVRES